MTEGRRAAADIDRHIKHLTGRYANQLSLRLLDLVMQATQHIARRFRVIVLHEVNGKPRRFVKGILVKALEKEATLIAKNFRLDEQHIGDGTGTDLHQRTLSRSRPLRYCP